MKKMLILFILACAAVSAAAQDITVASFNVRNNNQDDVRRGNGWEARCSWMCSLIEFECFDIFGAQEVLDGQLRDMLERLPEYSYIGVGRDDGKTAGEYVPIFYKTERFRLLDQGTFWLSKITDRPNRGWDAALPRICTWGRFVDRGENRRFWFFNLHLDHVGVKARVESAKLVVEKIREMCGKRDAVLLTGDFNVDQNDLVYDVLVSSGLLCDTYFKAEKRYVTNGTFNAFSTQNWTESRIDHIFVSPSFRVMNYGVLTETYRSKVPAGGEGSGSGKAPRYEARVISDHFPVVVKLDF